MLAKTLTFSPERREVLSMNQKSERGMYPWVFRGGKGGAVPWKVMTSGGFHNIQARRKLRRSFMRCHRVTQGRFLWSSSCIPWACETQHSKQFPYFTMTFLEEKVNGAVRLRTFLYDCVTWLCRTASSMCDPPASSSFRPCITLWTQLTPGLSECPTMYLNVTVWQF